MCVFACSFVSHLTSHTSHIAQDFGDMVPVGADRGSRKGGNGTGIEALDVALEHGGQQFGCY